MSMIGVSMSGRRGSAQEGGDVAIRLARFGCGHAEGGAVEEDAVFDQGAVGEGWGFEAAV